MVSMDPKLNIFKVNGSNPFSPAERTSFTGGEAVSGEGFSERHGVGKAAGKESNGIIGAVTGTGANGEFRLKGLYA